jgi:release factor glutamine methyltransferase
LGISNLLDESGLPRNEAERLMTKATRLSRAALAAAGVVDAQQAADFRSLALRRRKGEPLQYLEGTTQFGPLELLSDRRALVPRPETEQLWELAVAEVRAHPPRLVVDLCTGSGNLALALKHEFSSAEVYGTDTSQDALDLAAANAARTGLAVEWLHGDLFTALPGGLRGRLDLLVANPPYLSGDEVSDLPIDVREHEPRDALVAGPGGDEVLAGIAAEAADWLRVGGVVACEISEFRADRAEELFGGFRPSVLPDLTGRPRFVVGSRPAG